MIVVSKCENNVKLKSGLIKVALVWPNYHLSNFIIAKHFLIIFCS